MKTYISIAAASIIAVLSPVAPMIYIALFAIFLDTCFGIWRSVKKNGWISFKSRRLSATLSKSLLYSLAIILTFLVEKFIAGDLVAHFIAIELVMTKIVAFFCVVVEVKSINESVEDVTGKNMLQCLRQFITRAKNEAKELSK